MSVRTTTAIALSACLLATVGLPLGAALAQGDPTDQSSLWPEAVMARLERQGYSDLRSIDRDPFDNQIELEGINPEGERVQVTTDTTVGSVLYERPLKTE